MRKRKKKTKKHYGYAIIQKKDGYENKVGDIVEISLWKRNLAMNINKKYRKVVKFQIILPYSKMIKTL